MTMSILENDYIVALMHYAADIDKQLKIANKLKTLELKLKYPQDDGIIDNVADEID